MKIGRINMFNCDPSGSDFNSNPISTSLANHLGDRYISNARSDITEIPTLQSFLHNIHIYICFCVFFYILYMDL